MASSTFSEIADYRVRDVRDELKEGQAGTGQVASVSRQ
jgi:translation initiation factor 2 alpha subunit (eIF-2alpha)